MPLASALGDTLGLIVIFFVALPLLVNGLIVFAIAQALGERRENQSYRSPRESRQI